ncbi:MAG TPA: ankyrin repeat domain-containing protein [Spirochaetia bacterium]|nr:ankyrin repeat domain-containing protein [Spirochaetia bacterium]
MGIFRSASLAGMVAAGLTAAGVSAYPLGVSQLMEYGTPARIHSAIVSGMNVESRQKDGATPLMIAAGFNPDPLVIPALLKAGAQVNDTAQGGVTPLMYAAFNRNPQAVFDLLKAGAAVNARRPSGETALMIAAEYNPDLRVAAALVQGGADVTARDSNGRTALMYAAINQNPAVMSELITDGAKVADQDSRGMTPLMWTALDDHNPMAVSLLLRAGATGQARSYSGRLAYDFAITNPALKGTPELQELARDAQTAAQSRKEPQA